MAVITPPPGQWTLKNGLAPEDDRPPAGANSIGLPGGTASANGSQSSDAARAADQPVQRDARRPALAVTSTARTCSRIGVSALPRLVKCSVQSTPGVSG